MKKLMIPIILSIALSLPGCYTTLPESPKPEITTPDVTEVPDVSEVSTLPEPDDTITEEVVVTRPPVAATTASEGDARGLLTTASGKLIYISYNVEESTGAPHPGPTRNGLYRIVSYSDLRSFDVQKQTSSNDPNAPHTLFYKFNGKDVSLTYGNRSSIATIDHELNHTYYDRDLYYDAAGSSYLISRVGSVLLQYSNNSVAIGSSSQPDITEEQALSLASEFLDTQFGERYSEKYSSSCFRAPNYYIVIFKRSICDAETDDRITVNINFSGGIKSFSGSMSGVVSAVAGNITAEDLAATMGEMRDALLKEFPNVYFNESRKITISDQGKLYLELEYPINGFRESYIFYSEVVRATQSQ